MVVERRIVDYIEQLQYEVNARKDLCAFLISKGLESSEDFLHYHAEYVEAFTAYELAKRELEKKYAKDGQRWKLDFETGEITVYED